MEMYQKALNYKEKYLNSKSFFKNLCEKKMVKCLKEADQKGCIEASYALAIYYSSGIEGSFVDLTNMETEDNWYEYLRKAAMSGDYEIKRQYALHLITQLMSDDEDKYSQYLSGLQSLLRSDGGYNVILDIFENRHDYDAKIHPGIARALLMGAVGKDLHLTALQLFNAMENEPTLLKYPNEDLRDYYNYTELDQNVITVYQFFRKCKKRLVGDGDLPTDEASIKKLAESNNANVDIVLYYIGKCFLKAIGVGINPPLGFLYLKQSYEMPQSNFKAYELLGDCYYRGMGTKVDYKKALEIYEKHRYFRDWEYNDCLNRVNREKGDFNE